MGTPAFALPALEALIASPHKVVAVYSQPPRPAGRGMKLTPSPVQLHAEKHAIPVFTPVSLKPAEAQKEFAAHKADVAVVAAYGLLLPQSILDAPRLGCINIHPSDLPRWRGAAPIARTLMAGDEQTACCIMQMDAGLDTGPVLVRAPFTIPPTMTAGELHDAMAKLGAELLMTALDALAQGKARGDAQPEHGVTYAAKITRDDQRIDWAKPAMNVVNHIRALSPSPGATTVVGGEQVKIYAGKVEKGDAGKMPGTALDNELLINTGDGGAVRITELQRPGKARQGAKDFLKGFKVAAGTHAERIIHNP